MRWRSLPLLVLLVVIFGGLAGFVANLYFSQHPILITSGGGAYNVLRDVIMIVIAVLTVLTAVLIVIVGWALRTILVRDLRAELSGLIKESKNGMEESKNELFTNLYRKVGFLWGRFFEREGDDVLINYSIDEEEQALKYANMLDEEKYWELRVKAINDYLMALTEKGDIGNANMAYKLSTDLEQLLKEHEQELGIHRKQSFEETIYFARCRIPRTKSNDRENAIQNFYSLKEHPKFGKWERRWIYFELLTKDTNLGKS